MSLIQEIKWEIIRGAVFEQFKVDLNDVLKEAREEAVDIFRGECLMMGIDLGPMSGETVQRSLEAIKRAYRLEET